MELIRAAYERAEIKKTETRAAVAAAKAAFIRKVDAQKVAQCVSFVAGDSPRV